MPPQTKFYGAAAVGVKGQVVIPAKAREELSCKEGDKLVVMSTPDGGGVMFFKSETFEKMVQAMQHNFMKMPHHVNDLRENK